MILGSPNHFRIEIETGWICCRIFSEKFRLEKCIFTSRGWLSGYFFKMFFRYLMRAYTLCIYGKFICMASRICGKFVCIEVYVSRRNIENISSKYLLGETKRDGKKMSILGIAWSWKIHAGRLRVPPKGQEIIVSFSQETIGSCGSWIQTCEYDSDRTHLSVVFHLLFFHISNHSKNN